MAPADAPRLDAAAAEVRAQAGLIERAGLEMAGWLAPPREAVHVAFGNVLGVDRKMLKSRTGESMKFVELLDEALERAAVAVDEKNPDLTADERAAVVHMIGIGAVKYAELSTDRVKDYVFDWDRMLSFDGNTGPYLQYAHARICSIFRRAGVDRASVRGVDIPLGKIALGILFAAVAGYLVGLVGNSNNPISGLTLSSLVIAALLSLRIPKYAKPIGSYLEVATRVAGRPATKARASRVTSSSGSATAGSSAASSDVRVRIRPATPATSASGSGSSMPR